MSSRAAPSCAPGTTTYASYLHAGFAQLLVAAGLSVCLVLAGHRLLRTRGDSALEAVPGGRALVIFEGTLLVLAAVTVASCLQRLAIYVDAYGATRERLGVAFIAAGALGVVGLTFVRVVARGWRGHGGATLTLLTGLAVFASGFNADAYVAMTNLDRAARGQALDELYLVTLSTDAADVLAHPVVQGSAPLRHLLDRTMCAPATDDVGWRAWRGVHRCH